MKRISSRFARPGQVLSHAAYDSYGKKLLDEKASLDEANILLLQKNCVSEIFVEDPFTNGITAAPLVSPEIEGQAALVVKKAYTENYPRSTISIKNVRAIRESALAILEAILSAATGEISIAPVITEKEYLFLQPVKTSMIAVALGRSLGLGREQLENIAAASLFKDIGYIMLPREIIMKDGTLTIAETMKMREHCKLGHDILLQHESCKGEIASLVLQHHERWNGKGYPRNLPGSRISTSSQVIAIADQYASLLSKRPGGRSVYVPHQAVEYVMAFSGEYFDPAIVKTFIERVSCYSTGMMVKLNTGESGVVSDPKTGFVGRPVVRLFPPAGKKPSHKHHDIDLSKFDNKQTMVTEILEYSF